MQSRILTDSNHPTHHPPQDSFQHSTDFDIFSSIYSMGNKKKQLKIPKTEMPFMAQLLNRNGQKKKEK
jgi:hypothetical protein